VYISHQIWSFVINKYSTKKYLVGSQINKYKTILRELQEETPIIYPEYSHKDIMVDDSLLEGAKDDLEEFMKGI